jgi:hypothetical protein
MKIQLSLPSRKDSLIVVGITALIIALTAVFVGFRPEHVLMFGLFLGLFFATEATRKLAFALVPFIVFGLSYDWMRVYPNYMVNPIDVKDLYELEKLLFGMNINGEILTPNEYFAIHYSSVMDFFAGIFYLTWVPVPVAFGVYLYLKKRRSVYLRFALVFLLVNLIGFTGYYIHPAAAPWYVMEYGFEPILNTPGNSAGLARFDELLGVSIFDSIYGRNSNVFAAVPSLHSAYMVVALFYAIKNKSGMAIKITFTVLLLGIWFTAVYSYHHYIIDVLLGVLCAMAGIALFEYVLMKIRGFRSFFNRYYDYIK